MCDTSKPCTSETVSSIVGCFNGIISIVIHYDYIRDTDPASPNYGGIIGTNTKYTTAEGVPINITPGDIVTPGACPLPGGPGGSHPDWEYEQYHDDPNPCRRIIVTAGDQVPPVLQGFELNGTPVVNFDPTKIVDKCPCNESPCHQRTPNIVW